MRDSGKTNPIKANIEWNKGMAIRWIMEALKLSWRDTTVIYIGDDVTDEYAFMCFNLGVDLKQEED